MTKRISKIVCLIVCIAILGAIAATMWVAIDVNQNTSLAYDTSISDWGLEHFNQLDVNIYWYTKTGGDVPVSAEKAKLDKTKPTVIYAHGWKPSEGHMREGLSLKGASKKEIGTYDYDPYFYNYYLENGWNVGCFYWNQLADEEPQYMSCDTKIWCANTKNYGERYKTWSTVTSTVGKKTDKDDPTNPKTSVVCLYGQCIIKDLGEDFTGPLQLVGHSMGTQVTSGATEYLCKLYDKGEIGKNLLPNRVTLLDPYLSESLITGTVNHLETEVEKVTCARMVANACETIYNHGIPVEVYGTNIDTCFRKYALKYTTTIDKEEQDVITEKLTNSCAWVHCAALTEQYGGFSPTHVMTIDYYFNQNNYKTFKTVDGSSYVPSPQLPVEELKKLVGMMFRQECVSTEKAFYADKCTFVRVDPKSLENISSDKKLGRIYGEYTISTGNNKGISVTAYDVDGNEVSSSIVTNGGMYYIDYLPTGTYTLKFTSNGSNVGELKDVEVTDKKITVAETMEIKTFNLEQTIKIAVIVVGAVLIVVIVALLVYTASVRRRKRV